MSIPYILTENSLSFVLNNTPYVVPKTHRKWDQLIEAFNEGAGPEVIEPLVEILPSLVEYMDGKIQISNGRLNYNGRPLENGLTRRILQHLESGHEGLAEPLIALLDKTQENPSYRAVQGLYEWLERSNLPIAADGDIIAYKIVREDYFDIHSGEFDHTPGKVVEQPRNMCDEDPDRTCSTGLHFCSAGYLPHYGTAAGSRVVIVRINPRDVVAFPRDYDISKGRCCRMEVVGEVDRESAERVFGVRLVVDEDDIPMKFEPGQVWEDREGRKVTISHVSEDEVDFPVVDTAGDTYTLDGTYYTSQISPFDLVRLVSRG